MWLLSEAGRFADQQEGRDPVRRAASFKVSRQISYQTKIKAYTKEHVQNLNEQPKLTDFRHDKLQSWATVWTLSQPDTEELHVSLVAITGNQAGNPYQSTWKRKRVVGQLKAVCITPITTTTTERQHISTRFCTAQRKIRLHNPWWESRVKQGYSVTTTLWSHLTHEH